MKKYATISLFIFWTFTVAVLAAGLATYDKNQPNDSSAVNNSTAKITGISPKETTIALSKIELAKHNSSNSCWLLISGKIYDVTSFLPDHPGEAKTILPDCGTDATAAYNTKGGGGGSHSANANAMLADYYIGNLGQVINVNQGSATAAAGSVQKASPKVQTPVSNQTKTVNANPPANTAANTPLALTSGELAKHNSSNSCWLLISGKIYDVTSFLNQHPGNASTILPTCGTDATAAYASRGGTGSHSSSATAMLSAYYIGDLNQTVTTSPTNPNSPPVANPNFNPPSGGDDDDEFDD